MRPSSLADAAREALASPGLLCWCGLLAIFDAVSLLVFLVLTAGSDLATVGSLVAIQRLSVVAVLSLTLPGCYALYRRGSSADAGTVPGEGPGAVPSEGAQMGLGDPGSGTVTGALGLGIRAARETAPRLFVSSLVTRAVAIPAALVLAVLVGWFFLGIDTMAVWSVAVFGTPVDRGLLALLGILVSFAAGAWLVNGAIAYQDLLALDGASRPIAAWRESVGAVTARPLWFLAQALGRGLLVTAPWVVAAGTLVAAGAVTPTEDAGLLGLLATGTVFLGVATVARATLVALHVDSYAERVRPAVEAGDHSLVDRPRRVAMVAILVVAAVAGVAMVRTADIAPTGEVPDAAIDPAAADATVDTAIERTIDRDFAYRYEETTYEHSTGRWRMIFDGSGRIDRETPEGRLTIALHDEDGVVRRAHFYGADGIGAITAPPGSRIRSHNPMERHVRSGNWSAAIGRTFAWMEDDLQILPQDTDGWRRVAGNETTVTYANSDPAVVGASPLVQTLPDADDEHITYLADPEIRLVVDRETATVRSFTARIHFRNSADEDDPNVVRRRSTVAITAVGDLEVSRPDGLRGPGPLERVWDVLFYG